MEKDHDEGDLAAVVRASGVSAAYKWQTHHSLISGERASRTLITDLHTGAGAPSDTPPTLIAHSKSTEPHVVLPNLSRNNKSACMATPVEMQAAEIVNPYYNGSLLSRYASVSASLCSSLFEIPEKYSASSLRFLSTAAATPMSCDAEITNPIKIEGMNHSSKIQGMNHGLACGAASSEISRIPKVAEISKKDETNSVTSPSMALDISRKVAQGSSSSLARKIASNNSKCEVAAKRRKTQQKRIVCVPAAIGSNKPNGEDVPSDHWAWRKYGQKPIKGSPYPRGYYRCSSSKGCLARKQVERDRTDPSMVIMTYTSDHNHPWPTHRSSLAGSIRQTRSIKSEAEDQCPNQEVVGSKPDDNIEMHKIRQADSVLNGFTSIMEPQPSKAATEDAGPPFNEERLFNIHDEDISGLHISISALIHNDDFFNGNLPEPMNMFARQSVDDQSYDDDPDSTVVDPFNLFNSWSTTTTTFGEDKTTM